MSGFVTIRNKKAFFDYEILDKFEAGIMLAGSEVKSVRAGKASLKGAFVTVLSDGPYVVDMHIADYELGKKIENNANRRRKLLLKHVEIEQLVKAEKTAGLAIIPLSLYLKKGLFKLEIGIGRGKKLHDKRESLKRSSQNLDIKRALKHF